MCNYIHRIHRVYMYTSSTCVHNFHALRQHPFTQGRCDGQLEGVGEVRLALAIIIILLCACVCVRVGGSSVCVVDKCMRVHMCVHMVL